MAAGGLPGQPGCSQVVSCDCVCACTSNTVMKHSVCMVDVLCVSGWHCFAACLQLQLMLHGGYRLPSVPVRLLVSAKLNFEVDLTWEEERWPVRSSPLQLLHNAAFMQHACGRIPAQCSPVMRVLKGTKTCDYRRDWFLS